jgi:hypothetical protein
MADPVSTYATCQELVENPDIAGQVDLKRFNRLHPDGRRLIRSWFTRAWRFRDAAPLAYLSILYRAPAI